MSGALFLQTDSHRVGYNGIGLKFGVPSRLQVTQHAMLLRVLLSIVMGRVRRIHTRPRRDRKFEGTLRWLQPESESESESLSLSLSLEDSDSLELSSRACFLNCCGTH